MTSKAFPAIYENVCSACGKPILLGQMIVYPSKTSKALAHVDCSSKPPEKPSPEAPPAPAEPSEPPKDRFVFLGAYVPPEAVSDVLAAIKKARGWT